jgi:hypothetical protein
MKPSDMFRRTSSVPLSKRVGFFVCCAIMLMCVVAQGLYFYARDGVTPDPLPRAFFLSDCAWLLLVLSVFVYLYKPVVTMAVAWLVFAVLAVSLERFTDDHTLEWFFYRHSLILLCIVASHVGFLFTCSPIVEQRAE